MKKHFGLLLIFIALGIIETLAQTFQPKQLDTQNKGIIYNREVTFDMKLQTNGPLAIGLNFGKIKTYYKTTYLHFELGELKHTKEYRQSSENSSGIPSRSSRAYIFGKRNNLLVLRGGMGVKRYFTEKAKHKGVAVGINYEGGPSLGLLKPYYLELRVPAEPGSEELFASVSQKFSSDNAELFLNRNSIQGASGVLKGFEEMSPLPGVHGKISVHFDWGAFDEIVKALEVGVMADVYFRKVPIMVDEATVSQVTPPVEITPSLVENRPFFINFFITLQLGKRW